MSLYSATPLQPLEALKSLSDMQRAQTYTQAHENSRRIRRYEPMSAIRQKMQQAPLIPSKRNAAPCLLRGLDSSR
jgi:hypothetical protein